ncbi:MAG TPA: hypothetical protein VEK79_00490 [Thermoanaerobaculia bacterium]|nr:hypothetical protein [Thermoanaerobaculia bacterium]
MSFRIQKSLGNSFFQFSVGRRRDFKSIDDDKEMSTGPAGEFIRHRPEIFYSADIRQIHVPEVPAPRTVTSTPFWGSMIDGTPRGWTFVGLMAFGALLLLLGLANIANGNRGGGGFLVVLGIILAAIPVVLTSAKRRSIRLQEEKIRKERQERDERDRQLLAAYTTSLEKLRDDPSDANLLYVQRENEKLDLPYAVWADTAIGTVLYVGFSTLAKVGPERAAEVAELMDRASDAAGLIAEDARGVKHALYSTILWHFIADDRLGQEQTKIVRQIQEGFRIKGEDVPIDTASEAQFNRLRGIDHRNAPRCETQVPLRLNEYCMYTADVRVGDGAATTPLYITNKRLILGTGKAVTEVEVPKIDHLTADADASRIAVRASELKRPLEFTAGEPIYLAAILDLASRLDDRPKSFT